MGAVHELHQRLGEIAAAAVTAEGRPVAPVAWECNCLEEVCGACTMLVNGRVRQACTALVDSLLAEKPGQIESADDEVSRAPRPGRQPGADVRRLGTNPGVGARR